MRKYLVKIIVGTLFAATSFAILPSNTQKKIYFGFYTNSVNLQPFKISGLKPQTAFNIGVQSQTAVSSSHLTLETGLNVFHMRAGDSLTGLALYPEVRFYLYRDSSLQPFFAYAVGPAWLFSKTLGGVNLGGHFTFQNTLTFGLRVGTEHVFNFMLQYYHYTNLGFSKLNPGVDIPLMFTIGYRYA